MRRLWLTLAAALAAVLTLVPVAHADFGLSEFDVQYLSQGGSVATQAGSHPFAVTGALQLNTAPGEPDRLEGELKDLVSGQPVGFAGSPDAVPRCTTERFLERNTGAHGHKEGVAGTEEETNCPDSTAIGVVSVPLETSDGYHTAALYNLVPPPGVPAKFGFVVTGVPVTLEAGLSPYPPYRIVLKAPNAPQVLRVFGSRLTLWGIPGNSAHDPIRGYCADIGPSKPDGEPNSRGLCSAGGSETPFLTLPRSCEGPLRTTYAVDSWEQPGTVLADGEPNLPDPNWKSGFAETHDEATPPNPLGMTGCGKLPFSPSASASPTSKAANSPTGLDFGLNFQNEGIESAKEGAISAADLSKAVVTLPEGFTVNPSIAEGLTVCGESQLASETAFSDDGEGCPSASKIGTVEAESPVIEETLKGSIYQATPYENPFGALVALYMVFKSPNLGINIVQPLKVETDPLTGRITTTAEDLPQQPVSHFRLHFREGARSPLATPPGCGAYTVNALLYPSSGQAPLTSTTAFEIISGPNASGCPSGGTPPFHPTLTAGTINNAAGSYSPFNIRLSRTDSEQEITHFSIKLPPGVTGKLAGIPFCSDQQIAAARSRERQPHGGQEELEHPSCPQASEVGHTLVGSGVGPSLTYVPGKVYLAGPYNGSNLSIVAITAAKAGPFDLGTVVIREALKVNPETAEVSVDAGTSDPIPHIVDGIPVHLRDIRVYVDRPEFVKNPTNCEPTSTASTVLGSGTDFASEADDRPVTVTSRFQAADCANLGFKPALKISLKGPTKRAGLPALTAVVTPRAADANIGRAVVTLPPSEFLEQAHIGNSCTRVQFNAGGGNGERCPANSVLGHAKAITPLLDEPLEGPVFLRSNGGERQLPDLVAALHSTDINIDLVGFISSLHKKGSDVSQIRTTFAAVPDQPVTSFTLQMFGGKKGLLVNSTNLCKGTNKAISELTGQNGKVSDTEPAVKVQCGKKGKGKKGKGKSGDARGVLALLGRGGW